MNKITREGSSFEITHYPWEDSGVHPKTIITIGYDDEGYNVHYVSYETELRAVETEHNSDVYKDSCMEIYMAFAEGDNHYMNVEVNPNGATYVSLSTCREESVKIDPKEIDTLGAKTQIFEDRWEIDYKIPKEFLEKYFPTYKHGKGAKLRGNFYKCGDATNHPHWGCYADITWEYPDFHRPEFFAEFELV